MNQRYRIFRSVLRHLNKDEQVWTNACVYLISLSKLFSEKEIRTVAQRLTGKYPIFSKRLLESYGLC